MFQTYSQFFSDRFEWFEQTLPQMKWIWKSFRTQNFHNWIEYL